MNGWYEGEGGRAGEMKGEEGDVQFFPEPTWKP